MPIPPARSVLIEILSGVLPDPLPDDWEDGRPLVEAGLDSVGVLALVDELEQRLGFRLGDDELVAENFATLEGLLRLLASRTAS